VEPKQYNQLLFRLLALPIAALATLALVLGYSLERVQQSAHAVDHSDQIIAHANLLSKLIIDEETGLRGFLLTQDSVFLQPFQDADKKLEPEFEALFRLSSSSPDQIARLHHIQVTQGEWEQAARQEIALAAKSRSFPPNMLLRKQKMDDIRAQLNVFIATEEGIRAERSVLARHVGRLTLFTLIALVVLVAVLIAWGTLRTFRALVATYNRQIAAVRRRGEEAYEREQWLNTTLRSIGDAVIACDADGNIEFMNKVAEKLTGWREAEAKGKSLHDVFRIFNEDTREAVENPVDKVRRLGTIVGLANHTFLVAKDGSEVPIDDSGAPIHDTDGRIRGIVLIFRDIAERRLSEKALMRAEKLAAAGRMAASVAHEVNNPLEGLTNLIYIARRSPDSDEVRQSLDQAEIEIGRIAHITRQSLGFYREALTPAYFQPAAVAREVADFYSARARSQGVALTVEADCEVKVLGKAGELRQIVSNLLANSLDACLPGSAIHIRTRAAVDPNDSARCGIRMTVCDSGAGIRPQDLAHIFEPFYTTKKDTGTGLGLWVCRELVEKHGGTLRVRSSTANAHAGSVFTLFLPEQGKRQPESPATTTENFDAS
jgi:PAS domain S-box-containing protein